MRLVDSHLAFAIVTTGITVGEFGRIMSLPKQCASEKLKDMCWFEFADVVTIDKKVVLKYNYKNVIAIRGPLYEYFC